MSIFKPLNVVLSWIFILFISTNLSYAQTPDSESFAVTFSVNTANIEVGPNGMYAGGGMLGDAMALPLSDDDGDGVWTGVAYINSGTTGNYTLLNSPAHGGDWGAKENIAGLPCADAANWNDRILPAINSDTTLLHCFATCDNDGTCPVISGCTDESAMNYNPAASEDDGSCEFLVDGESPYCDTQIYHFMNEAEVPSSIFISVGNNGANSIIIQVESADADPIDDMIINSATGGYTLGVMNSSNGVFSNTMTWNTDVDIVDINVLWSKESFGGNWQWSQSNVAINVNDTCDIATLPTVSGCTDAAATNFNSEATVDDGSCEYASVSTTFNVDMNCAGVEFSTVHITGPIWGWTADILMSDDDGDGIYSITFDDLTGDVEYKYMVDYWASQEDLVDDMVNGATCAPVTDYFGYANRQVAAGSTTADTYGSCSECSDLISGCTDAAANNYNPNATEDDGSCNYCDAVTVNFSVDAGNVVSGDYDNVVINGSFANWFGWGVTLSDEDADGVYTGSTTVEANVVHEYVHALTGAADGWSGWGVIGFAPEACQLGVSETTGDASPNYFFSGECGEVIDLPTVCFSECTECVEDVPGCTDASADNFDPNANTDDGSCTYCNSFEVFLIGTSDVSEAGASDGSVQATGQGGSNNYEITVADGNGVPQNSFALAAGDYTVTVTDVTSGCEASTSITISEPVVTDNPCDIVPTGLFADNIIHNRVVFNWSAPSAAPSHYMIRYRVVGTSSWTVMTAGPVNSNAFTGTSRTRYFMEPGTTYEWSMRARVL
ncbi:MAG: fibronectin type III domain-containing protein, partial [Flavobacteriales bacterium]|nr:fibronectin type III domain-containing protein [Flavobacteriales bacterium]